MYIAENIDVIIGNRKIVSKSSTVVVPGKVTVLVGPNGAGKSTLLKAMTGQHRYSNGMVSVNGRDLKLLDDGDLALQRAVLPQSSSLSFPFTVYEVVKLGMLAGCSGIDHNTISSLPQMALERVGMQEYSGKYFQELSGGEQQRVHLARVLCQVWKPVLDGTPRYLFLDEPISNLDIRHQIMIMQLAREFAEEGGGVLAVLHDLNIAAMSADEIIAMKQGRVVATGKPEEVFNDDFMRDVFSLPIQVSRTPKGEVPYLLPQTVGCL